MTEPLGRDPLDRSPSPNERHERHERMREERRLFNRRIADRVATETAAQRRISWGAIFAGGAVALALQLMLNLLGLAVGLGVANPDASGDQVQGLALGAGLWMAVSAIIAVFAGGWAAGRLAGVPRRVDGVLHGFVAWAVATFVALYLVASGAGSLASGAMSVVQQGAAQLGVDRQGVQQLQGQAQQLAQQARRSSDRVLGAMSSGALWAFVALVVGAAAGAIGGGAGAPKRELEHGT